MSLESRDTSFAKPKPTWYVLLVFNIFHIKLRPTSQNVCNLIDKYVSHTFLKGNWLYDSTRRNIDPRTITALQKICRKASHLLNEHCEVVWLMQCRLLFGVTILLSNNNNNNNNNNIWWGRPEYWEESWRLEETCFRSVSSKRRKHNRSDST